MVCRSDQPSLDVADIETPIHAFCDDCPRSIPVPTHEGRRGNPVVLARRIRDVVLAGDRDLGCARLIQKYPEDVWHFPMASDHCVSDLDTPENYARPESREEATGDAAREPNLREH